MSQQDYLTNPEFVFQRENIYRHRLNRRKSGFLLLPLGIVLLAIPMTVGIAALAQHAYAPHLFEIAAGVCGVLILIRAVLFLREGYKPITSTEVEQRRRRERNQLFQQAQGAIPWQYSNAARFGETILGILLGIVGIWMIVYTVSAFSGRWSVFVVALLLLFYAAYAVVDALLLKAQQAKRLIRASSRELALRLSLGEMTQGKAKDSSEN